MVNDKETDIFLNQEEHIRDQAYTAEETGEVYHPEQESIVEATDNISFSELIQQARAQGVPVSQLVDEVQAAGGGVVFDDGTPFTWGSVEENTFYSKPKRARKPQVKFDPLLDAATGPKPSDKARLAFYEAMNKLDEAALEGDRIAIIILNDTHKKIATLHRKLSTAKDTLWLVGGNSKELNAAIEALEELPPSVRPNTRY